ncbi:metallophosphoesterase [Nannocystis sp. SCPEA4]|uniref:metallophosphoesterase family protein n=1 Tax=Nannocystis sp. SCPEA4 TaxID=2996787 RepID=UPI00227169E8|nr:metallophosphoesterase [Nannocystis sp. SCPEA4]
MRIVHIDSEPLHTLAYLDAAPGGGSQTRELPLLRARVDQLPAQLDALLVTSDLQGRAALAEADGALRLLGEVLAEEYVALADLDLAPDPAFTGVVLAGDLFAAPAADHLGATGDVRDVWRAFAARFRWVSGVAGNHDLFGKPIEQARFVREPGIHLLDGRQVELDDLRVAGVGGICGRSGKPNRRPPDEFVAAIRRLLPARPHLLVLHEGPEGGPRQRGNPDVRDAVDGRGALVVCGHCHWHDPLAELPGGAQVLNVDARAVLLERADA